MIISHPERTFLSNAVGVVECDFDGGVVFDDVLEDGFKEHYLALRLLEAKQTKQKFPTSAQKDFES